MASNAKDIQLRELKDTVSQLKTMISEQTELIKSLRLMIDEKTSHEKALQEQVDYLTKKLFGSSSEKRSDDIPGQQNLFDEAEIEQDPSLLEEKTVIREHTRKKKAAHEELFKGLKVEKVVIPLPEEDQICPVCGTQMVLIGEEYVRRELEFIPATCKVIEYYSQSYGCPSCKEGLGDTEKPVIVKSQVPSALVGKGPASASTAAWTMYQKYANGIPLYRQEKDWEQYGAQISRTTLANWIIYCSQNYFQPMYDYFHRELLKRSFAMADETRVQVLNEEGRRAKASRSCGCSEAVRMDFRQSSCMAIPRPGAAVMQRSFWKATMDTWKRMAIRDTIIFRGSDAALVLGTHPPIFYRRCSQRQAV